MAVGESKTSAISSSDIERTYPSVAARNDASRQTLGIVATVGFALRYWDTTPVLDPQASQTCPVSWSILRGDRGLGNWALREDR